MKAYQAVIVFLLLASCSAVASLHSYRCAEGLIVADMNQALAQTLDTKREGWITPDTIRNYRSHLQIAALRKRSMVCYAMDEPGPGLCSRKMRWHGAQAPIIFQGYANCSAASVFALSDQRLSFSLSLAALLWLAGSIACLRRQHRRHTVLGGLAFDAQTQCFYDSRHRPVAFTPMQQQLMTLFFTADEHRLSKQVICDTLWPKKPDASDTLYTLIKRLKPVVAGCSRLQIVSDRGKDYQLRAE